MTFSNNQSLLLTGRAGNDDLFTWSLDNRKPAKIESSESLVFTPIMADGRNGPLEYKCSIGANKMLVHNLRKGSKYYNELFGFTLENGWQTLPEFPYFKSGAPIFGGCRTFVPGNEDVVFLIGGTNGDFTVHTYDFASKSYSIFDETLKDVVGDRLGCTGVVTPDGKQAILIAGDSKATVRLFIVMSKQWVILEDHPLENLNLPIVDFLSPYAYTFGGKNSAYERKNVYKIIPSNSGKWIAAPDLDTALTSGTGTVIAYA